MTEPPKSTNTTLIHRAIEAQRIPLGIQRFLGDHLEDTGMLATGLMIAVIPIIAGYVFFSEKMIQGMTAGALK